MRQVTGIAYLGDTEQAFGLHTWNQVRLNGRWRSVDPTWNQLRADASHIQLVDDADAQWLALEDLGDVSLELISVSSLAVSPALADDAVGTASAAL